MDYAFGLDIANAEVNGSTVSNIDSFSTQGIGYDDDTLYLVLTPANVSIVPVYDDVLDYCDSSTLPPPTLEAASWRPRPENGAALTPARGKHSAGPHHDDAVPPFRRPKIDH